jgi:3-oxoacyl-[acyl-carrier protein] reductase
MSHSLAGRTAIVTGVSRRRGIGFAVACRLAELGADILIQHYAPHDADQPWGADDLTEVLAGIRTVATPGARIGDLSIDLATPGAAERVIESATALTGRVDIHRIPGCRDRRPSVGAHRAADA